MIYEKSCGAAVYVFHNGLPFFLVEYMTLGHVSIPKGHMEEGETEEETALREIREETSLEVRLDTVFRHEVTYSPREGVEKTVVFFVAEATNTACEKPQEEEVRRIDWLFAEQAIPAMTYETDREVLRHATAYLSWKYYRSVWRDKRNPGSVRLLCREHAADIHSHIIPGADDGAKTPDEAQELTGLDREEGIDTIFATPHYGKENGYAPDRQFVRAAFDDLCLDRWQPPYPQTELYLGTEWYCSEDIVNRIRREEAFPMGESDWYMVEFLEWGDVNEPAEDILRRLKKMKDNRIKTILAHPERYNAIQEDWNLAKRICDLGVLLQVNAYDLYLNKNDATRNLAQWMAKEGMISFIGSDMHGTRIKEDGKPARRPQMKEGIRWLYENVKKEYADEIVRLNAEKYLGVERLP